VAIPMVGMAKTVSGISGVPKRTAGIVRRIGGPSHVAIPMVGMAIIVSGSRDGPIRTAGIIRRIGGPSHVAKPMVGMAKTDSGISPGAMPTAGMVIEARGTSIGMPMGGMIASISGNSRPLGVSIIILVLLIIVPAVRYILNLPILPPIRQAIPIIPPSRRVKLGRGPVFATPMLPGMPLCLKTNLLQG
jgi:hypothetical protein